MRKRLTKKMLRKELKSSSRKVSIRALSVVPHTIERTIHVANL